MSSCSVRLEAAIDRPRSDVLQYTTDIARRAMRADAAFLLAAEDNASTLLCSSGDAGALATAFVIGDEAMAGSAPVTRDDLSRAWLATAVRLGERRGALCVAANAPRAFDGDDVATAATVATLIATLDDRPRLPLQSLVDLSSMLLLEAETETVPAESLVAAADSLDVVAARLRCLAAPPRAAPEHRGVARILLADDLDLNRRLIADMLSLDGHRVDCVSDGAEAVRAVAAEHYDLVLMDMIMPEMDGLAATRAIRALPGPARDVPIVALTANTMRDQLDSCLAAGMNATLTKPMSLEALGAAVAQWTRGRHAA